jgi:hypothetical protein
MDKEEATKAYEEGKQAFLNKLTLKDCPYSKDDDRRFLWISGYNVEKGKTESCNYKKIFRK